MPPHTAPLSIPLPATTTLLIEAGADLTLRRWVSLIDRLWPWPASVDEVVLAAAGRHAAGVRRRLQAVACATDEAGLNEAVRRIASVGPVAWVCSGLPWSPEQGLPAEVQLRLAHGARLRRIDGPAPVLEPAALALLAELGAFERGVPFVSRLVATADEPAGDARALRLCVLAPGADAAADDGLDEAALSERIGLTLADARAGADAIVSVTFDVDDQSPEDLATGLERVRSVPGVLDVTQAMGFGKKGRISVRIEVLVRPAAAPAAIRTCLQETSTIGLRWQRVRRVLLARDAGAVPAADGSAVAIKRVLRPGGAATIKAEADALAFPGLDYAGRRARRA
jgi:hypothetical protein